MSRVHYNKKKLLEQFHIKKAHKIRQLEITENNAVYERSTVESSKPSIQCLRSTPYSHCLQNFCKSVIGRRMIVPENLYCHNELRPAIGKHYPTYCHT